MKFDKFSFQPKTVFIPGIESTNDLDRIKEISRQKSFVEIFQFEMH